MTRLVERDFAPKRQHEEAMVTSADFVTQQKFLFTKFFIQGSENSRQALILGSLDCCDALGVCRVGFGIPPQHVLRLQCII